MLYVIILCMIQKLLKKVAQNNHQFFRFKQKKELYSTGEIAEKSKYNNKREIHFILIYIFFI